MGELQQFVNAWHAAKSLRLYSKQGQSFVLDPAVKERKEKINGLLKVFALNVARILWLFVIGPPIVVVSSVALNNEKKDGKKEKRRVYNITVEKDFVYYANGVLVANCLARFMARPTRPESVFQSSIAKELMAFRKKQNSHGSIANRL